MLKPRPHQIFILKATTSLNFATNIQLIINQAIKSTVCVCEIHTILIDRYVRESISDCLMRNKPLASADYSSKSASTSHFGYSRTTTSCTATAFDASMLSASQSASRLIPSASISPSLTVSTPISTTARTSTSSSPSTPTSISRIPRTYSRTRN